MIKIIRYERLENIGLIQMDDGKANAMQGEFLTQMQEALDQAERDEVRALVITGRERFFSGGLDLKTLPSLGTPELKAVLTDFTRVMQRVFLFPAPVICAAGGHALAGGMILYLAGDSHIAVDDDAFRFGLNEVAIGVAFPRWLLAQCALSVPPQYHTQVFLHSEVVSPATTIAYGITQGLARSYDALLPMAMARAKELTLLDPAAYRITKQRMRGPALENCADMSREELADFAASKPFAKKN